LRRSGGEFHYPNPILVSFIAKGLLPYRGLGSGVKRACETWSDIDLIDDREGCQFMAIIHRKERITGISE
jgi:ATP-dependent DNA helicase RecG